MIGGGVMGEAILSRLLSQGVYTPQEVLVSEPNGDRRDYLVSTYNINVTSDNKATQTASEVILLAIKPQILDLLVAELDTFDSRALIISILAGVTLFRLEKAFPEHPVIRVMPNTPATVGAGMTAIASGQLATSTHVDIANSIFRAVGEVVEVPEYQMDAVTGLSGSGPAFVALMIEALSDGGVASGLPRAIAIKLAIQTVLGTAQLLQQTNLHPGQLKDQVTSPGGTTIAGVATLEKMGFRSAIIEAVKSAYQRSCELGK
jgi:pyrroline-5-carboxylate reductase